MTANTAFGTDGAFELSRATWCNEKEVDEVVRDEMEAPGKSHWYHGICIRKEKWRIIPTGLTGDVTSEFAGDVWARGCLFLSVILVNEVK